MPWCRSLCLCHESISDSISGAPGSLSMHHGNGAVSILVREGRVREVLELKLPQLFTNPGLKIGDSGKYIREEVRTMYIRSNAMSLPIAD